MQVLIWTSLPVESVKKAMKDEHVEECYRITDRMDALADADVLFGAPLVESLARIKAKWIQLDSVDSAALERWNAEHPQCVVTNQRGVFSGVIAESILGSLLSIERGLHEAEALQRERQWKRWDLRAGLGSVRGKRVLLLGGGSIALEIVKLLRPFECDVSVFRRLKNQDGFEGCRIITRREDLLQIQSSIEILICTLPDSPATRGLLDAQLLGLLPAHAIVVNCGRGSTLDESTLLKLLNAKKLKAAVLDVTQTEPVPPECELWNNPRLSLTQHSFGGHQAELQWKSRFFAQNFKRFIRSEPLLNRLGTGGSYD